MLLKRTPVRDFQFLKLEEKAGTAFENISK